MSGLKVIGGKGIGKVGNFGVVGGIGGGFCGGAELGANYVGGKTGAEQIAIERGAFFLVERAFDLAEAAFEARADERGFICLGENRFQRHFNMLVGDATAAQFAGDAEFALVTMLRMNARVIAGVSRVVEVLEFFEFLEHAANVLFVFGAARQIFAHFVYGIRATHQGTHRSGVKVRFRGMFSRRREAHGKSIASRQ